jgi:hypothetical protein
MIRFRGLVGGGGLGSVRGITDIQGGVSTANLHEALSQKGLTTANLVAALANVPVTAPTAAQTQPAQSPATPKASGGS